MAEHIAFRLNPRPWITKTQEELSVEKMETSHILNTLNMIKDGRMKRSGCSGLTNAQWVRIFHNELAIRRHRHEQAQEQTEEREAAPRTPPG